MSDSFFSSACKVGSKVTQIIHFVGGQKKTFAGILSNTIEQGSMTKFRLEDGRTILINDKNVLAVEIISEG